MSLIITQGFGEEGGGGGGLTLVSLTPANTLLTLLFSDTVELLGPAAIAGNWTITNISGAHVSVVSVAAAGSEVLVTTTPHTNLANYTLHVPIGVLSPTTGDSFPAPTAIPYIGNGTGLLIASATDIDARVLQIIFSAPILVSDAINAANYTINGGIVVQESILINDSTVRLTTTPTTPGVVYTVNANVRDAAGNP